MPVFACSSLSTKASKGSLTLTLPALHCTGIRNTPESRTVDGFESQWAVNHLAPFLLTYLLLPTLMSSSTPTFASRIVNLSSGAHRNSDIHFSDPNLAGRYQPRLAYSQSKTANVLHANELERRYGTHGVHALSVHPGGILSGLQIHDDDTHLKEARAKWGRILKSTTQGAATTVWAAVGKVWEGKGGLYLEDCRQSHVTEKIEFDTGGVHPYCFDVESQKKLWAISCDMVGVKDDEGAKA